MTTATGERMDIPLEEAEKLLHPRGGVHRRAFGRGLRQGPHSGRPQPALARRDLNFIRVTEDLDLTTPIITYATGRPVS